MSEVPLYRDGNETGGTRFVGDSPGFFAGAPLQRYLAHENNPPPYDPTVARCLGTYVDPRGVRVSYARGTPVDESPGLFRGSPPRPLLSAVVNTVVVTSLSQGRFRGTSLLRKCPSLRTFVGPEAKAYCRVLGGGDFL